MSRTVYFTSDLHLGHQGILRFGQRKFSCLEDMHIDMVDKWNNKVRKNSDIVWILGDVCMDIKELKWLKLMNGEKRLILGNHDNFDYGVYQEHFDKVFHFHKAYKGMVLTHIPIHPCEMEYPNWKWNIHGHIHDSAKDVKDERYFNVNMDVIGFAPISLEELRDQLNDY